ncbi:peptidoglycan D,D-transpeptidase FtsI family protein [Ferviditalea candida]|uniref:Penicillin-binding transpeptidase domain-containing protein n=1 Tax=Ferviditalea candida TaxID=3108399 RepID=A0ABU5ZJD6_9BACL|nr:penicillin-binding transpeptidase domain-containing protein [Paenibacillaceae bacterium T2]
MKRRMFIALLILASFIFLLIGKLLSIQVLAAEHYSSGNINLLQRSVLQRSKQLILQDGRGNFYDRSLQPLTGQWRTGLAVLPDQLKLKDSGGRQGELSKILRTTPEQWNGFVKRLNRPAFWSESGSAVPYSLGPEQIKRIESLQIPGVVILPVQIRYSGSGAASQLIGFTGQDPKRVAELYPTLISAGKLSLSSRLGASGLEKTFDSFLQGAGPISLAYYTGADDTPLKGLSTRMIGLGNPFYPLKIVTTLDLSIQEKVERIMDRYGLQKGAVVVLDAANADVIAMASRPAFDPNHVKPQDNSWANMALKAITPGSVFKTVITAAALEEGVVKRDETFFCGGELGKYGFSCWKKGGHGRLGFEEAYAQSCNIVFAKVAERLTAQQLSSYAAKLGITVPVGWSSDSVISGKSFRQFDSEEEGRLFDERTDSQDEGVIVQTAIGQRDVRITPLQGANLVVTLLHHGVVFRPRVVKEIRYANGLTKMRFEEQTLRGGKPAVSMMTARQILSDMELTVDHGTAQMLGTAKWNLAGKTGTAQTLDEGRREKVNQWFTGFGPVESPRYAISVAALNLSPGSGPIVLNIVRDVMNVLAEER